MPPSNRPAPSITLISHDECRLSVPPDFTKDFETFAMMIVKSALTDMPGPIRRNTRKYVQKTLTRLIRKAHREGHVFRNDDGVWDCSFPSFDKAEREKAAKLN